MNTAKDSQINIEENIKNLMASVKSLLSQDDMMPMSAEIYIAESFMPCLEEMRQNLNAAQMKVIKDCQEKGVLMSQATLRSFTEMINFLFRTKQHLEQVSSDLSSGQSLATAVFQKRYVIAWSEDMKNHIKKLSASLNYVADLEAA